MPRAHQTTRALPMTEVEAKTLRYLLQTGENSEMSRRWVGNCSRLLRRLETDGESNVQRMLDVSTAHLTDEERRDLEYGNLPCQTAETAFGGILYSSGFDPTKNDDMPDGVGDTLLAIMRHAIARGCGYVMFDADAPHLPGFPVLEMEDVT